MPSSEVKEALVEDGGKEKAEKKGKAEKKRKGVRITEIMLDDANPSDDEDDDDSASFSGDAVVSSELGKDVEWDQERQKRETWSGKLDFILSCVGYAVGLGNVWRFPYLCYRSGGGAFLVPYIFFLIMCGMPLVMLEMTVGQFCSLSPSALYTKLCPLVQGIGWGMIIVSGIVCIYYNIIITWTLYYFYLSLRAVLPWTTCGNAWNRGVCVAGVGDLNVTAVANLSANDTADLAGVKPQTASEQFWLHYVLGLSPGVDSLGSLRYELVLCLALAWLLVFACLFKGVKSSGRVVYVTATFPYMVLIILFFRGVTLPGALDGITFYLWPQWHKLAELNVWLDAASQIFYSVGAAWGALITMASYNRFRHDAYRDAIIIPLINCGTSVFAGAVVFSIIGFMAYESPGLAFIVYPEAVSKFPLSPLWAVLFFIMLLTIGVDSQFGMFETLISALVDTWPTVLRKRKVAFTGLFCFGMFLLGLPFVTQGGMYLLQLMDWYSATFSLMVISMTECLVLVYVYGHQRFLKDIELMIRRRPARWWPLCWGIITPIIIGSLLILTLYKHEPVSYNNYTYPGWAVGLGWVLALMSLLPIPVLGVRAVVQAPGASWREKLWESLRPTPDWGPSRLGDRVVYRKSFGAVPSRQAYVKGVERQEQEMATLSITRQSYADLGKLSSDVADPDTFHEVRE